MNICRICFSDVESDSDPLISPCRCSGSGKLVHYKCLRRWITRDENVRSTEYVRSYSWKAFHCELCKSEYASRFIGRGGAVFQLFELEKPSTNYVVLESTQLSAST